MTRRVDHLDGAKGNSGRFLSNARTDSEALSYVRYDAKARSLFASFRGRRRRNYVYDGVPRAKITPR